MFVFALIVFFLCLSSCSCSHHRVFCPHPSFTLNRTIVDGYKTALIGEIHGRLWVKTRKDWGDRPNWSEYFGGHQLSRNLYFHIGVLGIDKVYLTVFYNETLYSRPPTIEEIYPQDKFCVVDWYKLGVLEWRPEKYGGPVEKWPLDNKGNRTQERDYYKSLRGYNPTYAEIRNQFDFVFVLDMDEQLLPVNYDPTSNPDWCKPSQPSLVSLVLKEILTFTTHHMLKWYKEMMSYAANKTLDVTITCPFGHSYCPQKKECRPITAISIPIYLWLRSPHSPLDSMATFRSKYPAEYSNTVKAAPTENHAEYWKSVYQTRYNPLLEGLTMHLNDIIPRPFATLAPRPFHGMLSFELVHQRTDNWLQRDTLAKYFVTDYRFVQLADAYHLCMDQLQYT